jgi:hypothetical protein
MKRNLLSPGTVLFLLALACSPSIHAQGFTDVRMKVTYVTAQQLYLNAGSEEGVLRGDTVTVFRHGAAIAQARVSFVSPHSAAALIITADSLCVPGDVAVITTAAGPSPASASTRDTLLQVSRQNPPVAALPESIPGSGSTVVRGRLAVQYVGEFAADSRMNVQQPALLASLRVTNLESTGLTLSLTGRAFHDLTDGYVRFGAVRRTRVDVYDFQLGLDRQEDHVGFAVGRMVSRYAGALGLLDGGQLFARAGGWTAGILAGRGIQQSALGIQGAQLKSAFFAGYQEDDGALHRYEGTVAFARQTLHGALDRQFLAFQGSAFVGASFQAFGSAEIDLRNPSNPLSSSSQGFSNASFFLNYIAAWWLSGSLSYDETRPVYLPQTMKSVPDSLFDDALQHGIRASVTARVSRWITLSGSAGYRYRQGDPRPSHTLVGETRVSDLLDADITASLRYANSVGLYLNGNDLTASLSRSFSSSIDVMLRYDHYTFGVGPLHQVYLTQTFTLDTYCNLSRIFYGVVRGDYVLDNTMNSIQVQFEVGMRL